ncbi:IS630 family transposase [Rhizophagus clarus]|uniref:IS630 family transposase n=1 Tax=Rhizophagus clarus TaxID=94130 RepID=A0A8H3QS35_9GLOM|nr:IS630 family transposase [Rhizophagus clarus]
MQGKFRKEQVFPCAPVNASEIKAQLEEKNSGLKVSVWSIRLVFSDETTIQMFCNTISAWSRDAKPIALMVKHPFKVHVWGAISVKGKIGMHMFIENLDHHLYRQILNEHLYDNANAMHGRRWVFQQDNDPKHTSCDVKSDLETHLLGRVLPWPSYSPDLNPIENVWAILKKNVEKKEWDDLDNNVIVNCINGMRSRIEACIDAEGGHTKY